MLLIEASTAETEVTMSSPLAISSIMATMTVAPYMSM